MNCENIISSLLIGIISGILSGFIVNKCIEIREKRKLSLIVKRILNNIMDDIKIYIQLFINKPINYTNNRNQNNQVELTNKINRLVKEIQKINGLSILKNKTIISMPVIMQLRAHLVKIIDNEFYFKHNTLLTDEQIEKANMVIKNIDLYLNLKTNKYNYTGITMTLVDFLNEIKDINQKL